VKPEASLNVHSGVVCNEQKVIEILRRPIAIRKPVFALSFVHRGTKPNFVTEGQLEGAAIAGSFIIVVVNSELVAFKNLPLEAAIGILKLTVGFGKLFRVRKGDKERNRIQSTYSEQICFRKYSRLAKLSE
jgi:hypothetical protein